ncbi:hypothetical protein SCOCK_100148 [Actinacidiphila cocklensis]|uniref:Uncharacterized protein n=1 Tax=Actinacidiphila cocklensis TaxID=887465 RepID=A0A9W4E1U3_9ACTN|nr:hypothetical protein SCOCK_100148 [Actinacidiphila cocklensis]
MARELRRRPRRGDDRPDPAQEGHRAAAPGRRGEGRPRLPVPAAGVGIRVRRRGVRGGTRLVRRRLSRRAGGARHPDRQRRLDAPRGEAGVHRGGAVRGVGRRAVARHVVPVHAVALRFASGRAGLLDTFFSRASPSAWPAALRRDPRRGRPRPPREIQVVHEFR